MKKILLLVLLFITTFALTACGEEYEYMVNQDMMVDEIPYEEMMDQMILDYAGAYSYSIDGDMYFYFEYYADDVSVCIDSNMQQDYIDTTILAVEELDALEYISITYHMSDNLETDFIEPCIDADTIIMVTSYSGDIEPWCSLGEEVEDDSDTFGCNWYNVDYDTGEIWDSWINYNTDLMDDISIEEKESIALHELLHTFGLGDIYLEELEEYSIMYGYSSEDCIHQDLTEFDLYNLEWMYGN